MVILWLCCTAAAPAPPEAALALAAATDDDPRQVLVDAATLASQAQGRGDLGLVFWAHLAGAAAHSSLDDSRSALASIGQARAVLQRVPLPTEEQRLTLEIAAIEAESGATPAPQLVPRLAALRSPVLALGDADLTLYFTRLELWLQLELRNTDDAWLLAEEVEQRARALGRPLVMALAHMNMGILAEMAQSPGRTGAGTGSSIDHLTRAMQTLGAAPARLLRAAIGWRLAQVHLHDHRCDEAMAQAQRALAISREIRDPVGIGLNDTILALALTELGRPGESLPLLDEARQQFGVVHADYRLHELAAPRIDALAALKQPDVLAEIERARRWDTPALTPAQRARLTSSMARGYAAMRQFDAAYRELLRSDEFNRIDRAQVLAEQTTRLQVRYDAVRRDAENAELRLRTQSAQFQIESQALQKRGLWLALIVLALLMTSAAIFGHRALARRRVFADLALRDELTGQPNRRAIAAYAAEQLQQTRRLALPMTVAMIDLDHFKQVNDRLGHSTGDAVLRSFARAVNGGLRGQDRLGRWGGEEWLLVMPGTGLAELPVIFERLRALFAQVEVPGIESPHHLSFSMGAAAVDAEMTGLDSVIEAADRQLYLAKHEGRDTLRCDA